MHKESREGRVFITGNKGDGKFTLKQAMKTQRGNRGMAVPFL
jgi:nucleoside-triphosphatase THEP1